MAYGLPFFSSVYYRPYYERKDNCSQDATQIRNLAIQFLGLIDEDVTPNRVELLQLRFC